VEHWADMDCNGKLVESWGTALSGVAGRDNGARLTTPAGMRTGLPETPPAVSGGTVSTVGEDFATSS